VCVLILVGRVGVGVGFGIR